MDPFFDISSLYLILSQVSAEIFVRNSKLRLRKTIFAEFSSLQESDQSKKTRIYRNFILQNKASILNHMEHLPKVKSVHKSSGKKQSPLNT